MSEVCLEANCECKYVINRNDGLYTLIHDAAFHGRIQELKKHRGMLSSEVNRRILPYLATPLRLAASSFTDNWECIEYLIQNGATVDEIDRKAQTALFIAIKNWHTKSVQILLQNGANANGNIDNISCPLDLAVQDGYLDGIKLLLAHSAHPDLEVSRRNRYILLRPLTAAAFYNQPDCFAALLLGGAEPLISDCLLIRNCRLFYCQLLREFGGKFWINDVEGDNSEAKSYFLSLQGLPLSLKSISRTSIRHALGRERLMFQHQLPLPKSLRSYLHFSDLIPNFTDLLAYPFI